jgi:hypothetical protein
MKILKLIGIVFGAIIAIVLILGLILKSDMNAERTVTINRSKTIVFDYIKLLKNQNNFSKWATIDPNMIKEFRGTDGTVGFVSAWKSENSEVGEGEQEIKGVIEGERIDYELRFIEPMASTATAYMITEAINDSTTQVKWGFGGNMTYPFNVMMLFMDMEKIIGDDFSMGLTNLKAILEN